MFVLLANFVPLVRGIGWFGWLALSFFLFLFFVLEPFYRRFTDRLEHHVLVLEFYLFGVYLVQLFFPELAYVRLLYLVPIFSGALSFGLVGTMLTGLGAFCLEVVRASPPWAFEVQKIQPLLPEILPLFILALLLGFTVELKNHTQRQLLDRLSKMDAFEALKEVVDTSGGAGTFFPFTDELMETIVEITEVRGGCILRCDSGEVVASSQLTEAGQEELVRADASDSGSIQGCEIYNLRFPWEESAYKILLWGSRLQGILKRAEREMIRALAVYLEHFVEHLRVQDEKERSYRVRETLIETVPLGILVTDSRGAIVEMNRSAGEILSCPPESAVGRRFGEVFEFEEGEVQLNNLRREVRVKSGEEFIPVDLSIREAEFEPDESGQWIVVFSDLRPLKKLQEKAERRRRLLALGEFAAGMAHEIRNPLGSLSGFISLLEEKVESTLENREVNQLIGKIQESYNRVDELVEDFLVYARQPDFDVEQINLRDFLEALLAQFELPDGVDLRTDISGVDGRVEASRGRLETALNNVLRNARDAVSESGWISVESKSREGGAVLKITDSGPGFPEEVSDKAFEPFVSAKEDGLGLGLAIVHRIVTDELNGEVELGESPAGGAEVRIFLPPDKFVDSEPGDE